MKNFKLFSRNKKDPDSLTARTMILPIVFCLVCGVLLIAFGNLALRITAYVLAGIMILCGVWSVVAYIRSKPMQRITESRLATGLILLVSGVLLAFNPDYLDKLLPIVWGLALLFGGFLKIQYAFDEKSVKVKKWWIMLIFAAVSLAIGILALLNKTVFGESQHLVIGIFMLAEAALDLITYFLLSRGMKKQGSLRDEEDFDLPVKPEALNEPAGPLPEPERVPEPEE